MAIRKIPPRVFNPGDDVVGCTVVGSRVFVTLATVPVLLSCPCSVTFEVTAGEIGVAERVGRPLFCPGCNAEKWKPVPTEKVSVGARIVATAPLTAYEIMVIAAAELTNGTQAEFTEWELTVASWRASQDRFGMRGFETVYPDHKRVSIELCKSRMGGAVFWKCIEKIRPNVYRLTPKGIALASRWREKYVQGAPV